MAPPRRATWIDRLDRLPPWAGVLAGIGTGGGVAGSALYLAARAEGVLPSVGATVVGLALAGGAVWLAKTARPIAIASLPPAPAVAEPPVEARPQVVRAFAVLFDRLGGSGEPTSPAPAWTTDARRLPAVWPHIWSVDGATLFLREAGDVLDLLARMGRGEVLRVVVDLIEKPANAGPPATDDLDAAGALLSAALGGQVLATPRAAEALRREPATRGLAGAEHALVRPAAPALRACNLRGVDFGARGLPLDEVEIPAGSFLMGSDEYDWEKPIHEMHVSAFLMGTTQVTRGQYAAVMGTAPGDGGADRPVAEVSWFDAIEFCNRLSAIEGLTPFYLRDGDRVERRPAADGYRLPTEAEWEYAARAGTKTRYFFGDDPARLDEFAWYASNAGDRTHLVGEKAANPWGLHDIYGNVWEWCWDWFGNYVTNFVTDPTGPDGDSVVGRVLRGGSFVYVPDVLRSAVRFRFRPVYRDRFIGFRCVRSPRLQHG